MKNSIRVLVYDDNPHDVTLIKNILTSDNQLFTVESAHDRDSFFKLLDDFSPHVITSDYEVPGFDGIQLLHQLMESHPGLPVIIVSGKESRELVLKCFDNGALDFVHKDRMYRLPGLLNSLKLRGFENMGKEKAQPPEKNSSLNYSKYEVLFNSLNDGIFLYTPQDFRLVDVNHSVSEMYGYTREEILKLGFAEISDTEHGFTAEDAKLYATKAVEGRSIGREWKAKRKDGSCFWIQVNLKPVNIEGNDYLMAVVKNIDQEVKYRESLRQAKSQFESLAQNSPDIIMRFDDQFRHLYVNDAVILQLGLLPELFIGKTHEEMGLFPIKMCRFWEESIEKVFKSGKSNIVNFNVEGQNGVLHFEWRLFPEFTTDGKLETVLGIARDISERIRQEKIQRILIDIANAATNTRNLEELFLTIQKSLNDIIDTKNCYVALYDEENDIITLPFHKDEKDSFNEFPAGKTTTGYVIRTGKSQLVDSKRVAELEAKGEIEPIGAPSVSWLGVPLKISEKIIGVFVVQSYDESVLYTENDVELLEFVSDQIARAIERKIDQDNLKHNEKRQRMILESSPDGLVVIGLQGEILESNTKFLELININSKNLQDRKFFDFISAGDVIKVQNILNETLTSGYSRNIEFRMKRSSGQEFFAEGSLGLIPGDDNLEDTFVIVIKDINERKLYEHNLRVAKDKAEESDRLKTAFLSNMSHEIRTPMNAIVGFAELISTNEGSKEDNREFIRQINQAADSLLRLIDDIIDISKIEAGQLVINRNRFSLPSTLKGMKTLFLNTLNQQGKNHLELIEINPFEGEEITMNTDEFRLRQIFINLINNAIKFTNSGQVSYGIKSIENKTITFFVKDTGIGISQAKQKYIFDRFRQGHENKKYFYGGTGLGLTISKNLVEQMGGVISVESVEGIGSEFSFSLPCFEERSPEQYVEEKVKNKTGFDWSGRTILIAEDEDSNFVLLSEILKKTNIRLVRAKDGKEAVDLVSKLKEIDLILMDVQMPLMNGYLATEEIRKMEIKTPVIAQTAYAMAGEREISLSMGCTDYISKPIKADDLFTLLGKYLDDHS